uniref:Uncharacterized protein n=1 Tax=virus sp. ctML55 TaxID=2827627 RepID=A0A8S5RHP8_9VIRU|nr:MAG TPA: hypothetical protein [virus sp. ctML55]DAV60045.1 MAG TPA: hypothetical protein [Caudoviricetes sp.]
MNHIRIAILFIITTVKTFIYLISRHLTLMQLRI